MTSRSRLSLRQWIRDEGETIAELSAKLTGAIGLLLLIYQLLRRLLLPPTDHVFRLLFTGLGQLPPRAYPFETLYARVV